MRRTLIETGTTWGCGYAEGTPKLQYTASSFVRSYAKLVKPVIKMSKAGDEINEIVPEPMHSETHVYDKIENALVDIPVRVIKSFLGRFKFLQNGRVQFYVLYGVVFITLCVVISLLVSIIQHLSVILKQI